MRSTAPATPDTPDDICRMPADRTASSECALKRLAARLNFLRPYRDASKRIYRRAPPTSQERLDGSLIETTLNADSLTQSDISVAEEKGKTVLYLAYGSNLCNETFRGKRGIRPISQVNVLVPSLRLTFDLPGIPYTEPCFANTAARTPEAPVSYSSDVNDQDYHKDRWHKGLVGCVYEVTPSDYAHIIETEGGGSAYQDILVDCYPLPDADTVPSTPTTKPFKAHTLFAPALDSTMRTATDRFARPDPSYAQPSARYLKLITDGATELSLPTEYQNYLQGIRPYTITSRRQGLGQKLFLATWLPFITLIFALQGKFSDEKGRAPKWLAKLSAAIFTGMWISYDGAFKKVFGDGERTEGQDEDGAWLGDGGLLLNRGQRWDDNITKERSSQEADPLVGEIV